MPSASDGLWPLCLWMQVHEHNPACNIRFTCGARVVFLPWNSKCQQDDVQEIHAWSQMHVYGVLVAVCLSRLLQRDIVPYMIISISLLQSTAAVRKSSRQA